MNKVNKDFIDYFEETIDYPHPTASENILPLGTLYSYISNTFLNGWINYVKIIAAQLISRYEPYKNNQLSIENIQQNLDKYYHFDFNKNLSDDVLILAKNEDKYEPNYEPHWWFFWYDRDCSDCMIGRFKTEDYDEIVISLFKEYANERSKNLRYENSGQPAIEIPNSFFKGWIQG
jgi:hypothetical protein